MEPEQAEPNKFKHMEAALMALVTAIFAVVAAYEALMSAFKAKRVRKEV